ncbi:hypothetical protein [Isoptericola sp. G70]|uniref:hypothetical protein n=1 Tax=Isoptericola sp. G70 TaxID=3376633 RepID=UPI003A800948
MTADWISALATFAAVVLAMLLALRDGMQQRRARTLAAAADRARTLGELQLAWERRRAQAQGVIGWFQYSSSSGRALEAGPTKYQKVVPRVLVANYSSHPVFDVRVELYSTDPGVSELLDVTRWQVLGPTPDRPMRINPEFFHDNQDGVLVTVKFRDLAGNYWLRRQDATLERLDTHWRPMADPMPTSG